MREGNNEGNITNIGEDIVKSFHEQFAQNQNHHQNLFIQILAILLSVLIGYGYLYIRVDGLSEEFKVSINTLYVYQAIAACLLSIATALISNMALGFRRDQLMAANIRIMSGVMTLGNNNNYFFGSFNPQSKTGFVVWMPEFHKIFFIGLIAVKVLMLWATIQYDSNNLDKFVISYPGFINVAMLTVLIDFILYTLFWKKWVVHTEKSPDRLKGNG